MAESKLIGLLFEDHFHEGLNHTFFSGIINGIKRELESNGHTAIFLNMESDAPGRVSLVEQVKQRKMDGVIVVCIDYTIEEVKELLEYDIPIVLIDEEVEGRLSVKSDNVNGFRTMLQYIIDMGHKRIAYITGNSNTVTKARLNSFLECCKDNHIEVPGAYIRNSFYRDMNRAAYYTEELLRLPNPPSCIIYPDDYAAIGGINNLHARGLSIPDDISVAGFDGLEILSKYEPRLTTIRQNTYGIGAAAAAKLLKQIFDPENVNRETEIIATELEKGRTVGRVYM